MKPLWLWLSLLIRHLLRAHSLVCPGINIRLYTPPTPNGPKLVNQSSDVIQSSGESGAKIKTQTMWFTELVTALRLDVNSCQCELQTSQSDWKVTLSAGRVCVCVSLIHHHFDPNIALCQQLEWTVSHPAQQKGLLPRYPLPNWRCIVTRPSPPPRPSPRHNHRPYRHSLTGQQ